MRYDSQWCRKAAARYREALLAEAKNICRTELAEEPKSSRLLHLRGLLAARDGDYEFAAACLALEVHESPCDSGCWASLGEMLSHTSRRDEALGVSLDAVRLGSDDAEVWIKLGRVLHRRQLLNEAVVAYQEAARIDPERARSWIELGDVQLEQHRGREACSSYEQARRLEGDAAELHARLGRACHAGLDHAKARVIFERAIRRYGDYAELHKGLGMVCLASQLQEECVDALRAALRVDPTNAGASRYLGRTLERLFRPRDAVEAWLAHIPALDRQRRFDEMDTLYSQILILRPTSPKVVADIVWSPILARRPTSLKALVGLAALHLKRREPQDAIRRLEDALALEPACPQAHNKLGSAAQMAGNFPRAWREFAWSYQPHYTKWRSFEQPLWDGAPLAGRTLLLWGDAGFGLGDAIHLLRYVEHLDAVDGRVVAECHWQLASAIGRLRGIDRAVSTLAPMPQFDVHLPYPLLPILAGGGRWPPPAAVPYVSPAPRVIERWRGVLGAGRETRIGISWGGTPTHRDARQKFLPLASFAPLARLPRTRLVSLQLGAQAEELAAPPSGLRIERYLHGRGPIDETAGLIVNLDLVITVDTMIAHLAGALGKPVWLLLSDTADTRWQDGERTPWYPTMRLFRQARPGDWSSVVDSVCAELERHRLF